LSSLQGHEGHTQLQHVDHPGHPASGHDAHSGHEAHGGDCPMNSVNGVSLLAFLGGRHAVGEGDGEGVQGWLRAAQPIASDRCPWGLGIG
jgi:hypothetical protein